MEINDTVNSALLSIINDVTATKNFILAQLPDVVQQLLLWESVFWSIWAGIMLCFIVFLSWMFRLCWKGDEAEGCLAVGMAIVFATCLFVGFTLTALKPIIAPKVWLIEYAAKLAVNI